MRQICILIITTLSTLCFPTNMLQAQDCFFDFNSFSTQKLIDDFAINHPDCTEILSDVFISGTDITSLEGLSQLTLISGNLSIKNTNLIDLSGLNNINSINGLTYCGDFGYDCEGIRIEGNALLKDLSGLEKIDFVNGRLYIENNDALKNLAGLNNLTSISSGLYINNNEALENLTGLENIISVGQSSYIYSLEICDNPSLKNLLGLGNLKSINMNLSICNNSKLTSLMGLNNLTSVSGSVTISSNKALQNFSGLENLQYTNGFFLYDNSMLNNLSHLASLTEVTGNFTVSQNNLLPNFKGLENLSSIWGTLQISGNSSLTSIKGLKNLTQVIEDIIIDNNDILKNLVGLENIKYEEVTGYYNKTVAISSNPNLSFCSIPVVCNYISLYENGPGINENATGCQNASEIKAICSPEYLFDEPCNAFDIWLYTQQDVDNFPINHPDCKSVAGRLTIGGSLNSDISSLSSLSQLTYINELIIQSNGQLQSLSGLDNLNSIGRVLIIQGNQNLSDCALSTICNRIANGAEIYVLNNGMGCNMEELTASCKTIQCLEMESTLYINNQFITTGFYLAEEEINAVGKIPAGAKVTFKSGGEIQLQNGFTVGSYGNFSACMEFCSD